MLSSSVHYSNPSPPNRKQLTNYLLRKTLISINSKKENDFNHSDPIIFNIRSKTYQQQYRQTETPEKQQQKPYRKIPIVKKDEKRKQALNKTFNRTKTDFAHNFVGRKYLLKIQEERKSSSLSQIASFKRSCKKYEKEQAKSRKKLSNISQQNIIQILKKAQQNKENPQSRANESKRYKNYMKIKKKSLYRRNDCKNSQIEEDMRKKTMKNDKQFHNGQITPWESIGNNSWFNP